MKLHKLLEICIFLALLGCEESVSHAQVVDDMSGDNAVEYRQDDKNKKTSNVEVEKLNFHEGNKISFIAKLVDPITGDKLDVSLEGTASKIQGGYFKVIDKDSIGGDSNIGIFLVFKYNVDGALQGTVVNNGNLKDPFSGQWSFLASRKMNPQANQ